jgi:hypothetical protein
VHLWTHLGWANGQLKIKIKINRQYFCIAGNKDPLLILFTVFGKVAIQNVLTNNWGSIEFVFAQMQSSKTTFFLLQITFHIPSLALVGNLGF